MTANRPETAPPPGEPAAYHPADVERKWRDRWRALGTNHTNLESGERPFYALMMFPYPSAEGLHVGNLFAFTGNDIYGRFQRLQGHTVFEPLGYDAFGIHSENYALKVGEHPSELIPRNIANFRRQLERAGLMVDWRYSVDTTDPGYYKWTQWVFLQLLRRGLAYRKKAAVNWCPFDKTVLANEQVENGVCERCKTPVEQRFLEQWFFRISDYSQRLLENLDVIDWSESTKTAQRNWIGRSQGAEITFMGPVHGTAGDPEPAELRPLELQPITVFTTRADTIFGATYLVLAPEHPAVERVTSAARREEVREYVERTARQDLVSRQVTKEKTGVFTGSYALNPATRKLIPIWIADYVLMGYGTGAIMGVPAHDQRDHEFATTYGLEIVRVVAGDGEDAGTPVVERAFTEIAGGRLVNSAQFDGQTIEEGTANIMAFLESRGSAVPVVNYRLHDWCISRQRYWGPPIPIIYCDMCGMQAVPEQDLPVLLPYLKNFQPDDSGISPLARDEAWYIAPCPECGKPARRETDVSDVFLDSAWYFLRYPSAHRDDVPFDRELTRTWLPVNSYIGGNEHSVLHLLYARFVTMALHDAGHLTFEEPFTRFRAHGLIIKDGAKMSKSKGNVVNPDEYMEEWGADAFRTYLMFLGPYESGGDFRESGISGVKRFLDRLWASVHGMTTDGVPDESVLQKLHQTIRKVGEDIPKLSYNTAIAAMMEYMNVLRAHERTPHRVEVEPLVQLVSPFAPHVAEELWETLGHGTSVFDAGWPAYDAARAAEASVELVVQVNGKVRGKVRVPADVSRDAAIAAALAEPGVAKFVSGTPRKVVYVEGRLVSLVV